VKHAEFQCSLFIAEHNHPYSVINLPQLINKICPDSKIAQGMKCIESKFEKLEKQLKSGKF